MIYKEHTRNQKRMYRIHKQEEKIQEQELIIASLQQRIDKAISYIKCGIKGDINDDRAYIDENALLDILGGKDGEIN